MTELKKCPFCGCNAGVLEYRRLHGPTLYKIACNSKKCRGHDSTGSVGAWLENGWRESREEAAELWNRRSEYVDRGALLELAGDMDLHARTAPYPSEGRRAAGYARRIREALGVTDR